MIKRLPLLLALTLLILGASTGGYSLVSGAANDSSSGSQRPGAVSANSPPPPPAPEGGRGSDGSRGILRQERDESLPDHADRFLGSVGRSKHRKPRVRSPCSLGPLPGALHSRRGRRHQSLDRPHMYADVRLILLRRRLEQLDPVRWLV